MHKKHINPLRLDPTRTTTAAKALTADITRRMRRLQVAIRQVVGTEDAFGLNTPTLTTPLGSSGGGGATVMRVHPLDVITNTRWSFKTDNDKITAYRAWLKAEVATGLLEVDTAHADTPWTAPYITNTYQKGMTRAYIDATKAGVDDLAFVAGGKKAFLDMSFNGPVSQSRIQTLGTRAFAALEGVSAQMDKDMTRILTQGMAAGKGADAMARDLNKNVAGLTKQRAALIARTELAHAHNEGQLDSFQAMNMEHVGVMAEWVTAGDDRVCPLCLPLEGTVYTIKEARGLLPRHPRCRCAWVPANVGEHKGGTTKRQHAGPGQGLEAPGTAPTGAVHGQTFSKTGITAAIRKSLKAERPKLSAKGARAASKWAGADTTITGKLNPGSKKARATKGKAKAARAAKRKRTATRPTIPTPAPVVVVPPPVSVPIPRADVGAIQDTYGLTDLDITITRDHGAKLRRSGLLKYTASRAPALSAEVITTILAIRATEAGQIHLAAQMIALDEAIARDVGA